MPKLLAVLVATLPLGANHGLPEVELRVDGTPVRVLIDTGAYTGIALRPALVPPSARFAGQRRFRDARGQSHEAREFSLDRLELAGLVERDVRGQELVHAPDFAPPNRDGYVGRELLSRWRLLFDVPAGRLQLHAGAPGADQLALAAGPSIPLSAEPVGLIVHGTDGLASATTAFASRPGARAIAGWRSYGYISQMERAKLSDVKDGLSRYVEKVRKGGTVRILLRGVAVADLVPIVLDDDEVIAEKELLTPGPKVKGQPPSEAIVAERRRR